MKKSLRAIQILSLVSVMVASQAALGADDLMPATSEDISAFDRQLSALQQAPATQAGLKEANGDKNRRDDGEDKKPKENFGQTISAEANKLKDSEKKKDFGKWVSGQRRRDDQNRPAEIGGPAAVGPGNAGSDRLSRAAGGSANPGQGSANGGGAGSGGGDGNGGSRGNAHGRR